MMLRWSGVGLRLGALALGDANFGKRWFYQ